MSKKKKKYAIALLFNRHPTNPGHSLLLQSHLLTLCLSLSRLQPQWLQVSFRSSHVPCFLSPYRLCYSLCLENSSPRALKGCFLFTLGLDLNVISQTRPPPDNSNSACPSSQGLDSFLPSTSCPLINLFAHLSSVCTVGCGFHDASSAHNCARWACRRAQSMIDVQ